MHQPPAAAAAGEGSEWCLALITKSAGGVQGHWRRAIGVRLAAAGKSRSVAHRVLSELDAAESFPRSDTSRHVPD